MIECKFSLNLSKNGVQKTVYAKAGEINARMLIITLSHNGKVYELDGHSAMVFLENGENFLADIVDNTVQAVIPNAFPEPQVRVCELRISKGDKVIYTPMFEIVFEVSFGNIAESESLVDGVKYVIKSEHDRADSHSISMVANLRDTLDSKASVETVTAHYNEFNKAFSDRDAVLDAYVKKTDGAITNLNADVNLLKETSHSHSNKSALDKLSDKDGTLAYNDKVISGISDADKLMLEDAYKLRHKHESASDGKNNLATLNGIDDDGDHLLYYGEPLAYMSDVLSNDLTQEQKENIKANTDARHTHKNKDILDCFGENTTDFRPMYLGKSLALVWDVPTKTSHLENDSGFVTKNDLPEGGSGVYVGSGDMPEGYNVQIDPSGEAVVIPTKTSELINDSGFITRDELPEGGSGVDGFFPSYVVSEAEKVIKRVLAAQGSRTFTFACITDMHYGNESYIDGIKHACQAMKYIDERIKLDAVAVLGDYTNGYLTTSYDDAISDYKGVNSLLNNLRFVDNLRQKGNHDAHPDYIPLTNRFIQAYSDNVVWGDKANGYFYKDFDGYKLRVICINANENNTLETNKDGKLQPTGNISCLERQYEWFASSLDLADKENDDEWQILVLSHQPLDWYYADGSYAFVKILNAYKEGESGSVGNVSYDFTEKNDKNSATLIGNIHGHIHNLLVGKLNNGNVNTTNNPINVVRIATPESCIDRANQYDGAWKQDVAYPKTVNTSQDTSFVIYCIDFDSNTITAVCYGAGYTRVINYVTGEVVNEEANEPILPEEPDIPDVPDEPDIPDEPTITYTNLIPLSIDTDGSIYGGVGYKANTRLSGSTGKETTDNATNLGVTGYIPVKNGDVIYLKNVRYTPNGSANCHIGFYKSNFNLVGDGYCTKESQISERVYIFKDITVDSSTGYITSFKIDAGDANIPEGSYMRISAVNLFDGTGIITKNEPIE